MGKKDGANKNYLSLFATERMEDYIALSLSLIIVIFIILFH